MAGGGSNPKRAILWAFGANLGIALAKSGAFFVTGSSSMLAESIHPSPIPATSCSCCSA